MNQVDTDKLHQSLDDYTRYIYSKRIFMPAAYSILIIIIYMQSHNIKLILITQQTYNNTNFKRFSNQFHALSLQRDFDVVLSYYREEVTFVARFIRHLKNVSNLQKLKPRIIVYNKNSKIDNAYLKTVLKADIVQLLPNVGREGATYLYHIIENYDILASHTLFAQAGADGLDDTGLEDWFSHRLEKQFNSTVGYMPMVNKRWFAVFDCGVNARPDMPRLAELWGVIEQTICPPNKQFVAYRGQFLVSARRIRHRPLRVYQYLTELITANSTHWILNDPRGLKFRSMPHNPSFGHILERLWTTLFSCTNIDLIKRCDRNECACYD